MINEKNNPACCEAECIHTDIVAEIAKALPPIDTLYDLGELFKVFGDSTRIRILYVLFEHEVCVCDISNILNMSVSAISHQLRVLKSADLVTFRKEGKVCYYSLADSHVKSIIRQGFDHVTEEE